MFSIANILTLSNLFLGCLAITHLFSAQYQQAFIFLMLATLADFLDGFVARSLQQTTDLGKQLDSLADVISFGFAPGTVAYLLVQQAAGQHYSHWHYTGYLLTAFAALRLARFNLQSSGSQPFYRGVPVPAMTLFFLGMIAFLDYPKNWHRYIFNFWVLQGVILIFCFLLVSRLKVIKIFLHKQWLSNNGYILASALVCLTLWKWLGTLSISLAVLLYVGLSVLKEKNKSSS